MAVGLLWLTVGFFGAAKWHGSANDNRGVVIADKIDVRAGPDAQETLLFQLHGGSQVAFEQEENGWRLIRYSPEKRGWTSEAGVAAIRPIRSVPVEASQPLTSSEAGNSEK